MRHQSPWLLVGAALLFLSVIFDCSDGQLARAKKISSTTGAIVDGVSDYIVGTSVAIGATYFLVAYYHNPWYWLLGLAGLVSTAVQSALFDHTKTAYAVRVGSGYSEREEDVQRITNERVRAWKEGRYRDAMLFWVYERYSKAQQVALHVRPVADPVAYRAANAGRMRAWTFLGIGTHLALGYLLGAAAYWWPLAIAGYFIICATVFNHPARRTPVARAEAAVAHDRPGPVDVTAGWRPFHQRRGPVGAAPSASFAAGRWHRPSGDRRASPRALSGGSAAYPERGPGEYRA